jgi:hypothetical protein
MIWKILTTIALVLAAVPSMAWSMLRTGAGVLLIFVWHIADVWTGEAQ